MSSLGAIDALSAVVTADCNLRCSYCYQDRKQPLHMSWPTLSAAIDLLLDSRRRRVSLSFLGGEPLLDFPLIARAVAHARRRLPPHRRLRFFLTTNGTLLTDRRLAFLARHRVNVQLSFDGVPQAQDLRAPGSFNRLDGLIDRMKSRHRGFFRRRVTIAVTVAANTIPHLANSFEYLLTKGVSQIAISAAMGQGRLSTAGVGKLDRQFQRIFTLSVRHYRATGEVPLSLFQKQAQDSLEPSDGEWACSAAVGNALVVDVDGRVYPCAMLIRSCQRVARPPLARRLAAMSLGYVTEPQVLADRLEALPGVARAVRIFGRQDRKRSSDSRCATCRFVGACLICPITCAKNPDSTDPNRIPDYQCAFNRVAFKYRRRFPCQPQPTAHAKRPPASAS